MNGNQKMVVAYGVVIFWIILLLYWVPFDAYRSFSEFTLGIAWLLTVVTTVALVLLVGPTRKD